MAKENKKFGPHKYNLFGNEQFKINFKKVDKQMITGAQTTCRGFLLNLNKFVTLNHLGSQWKNTTEFIFWYMMSNPFLSIPVCQFNLGVIYNNSDGYIDFLKTDEAASYTLKAAENEHQSVQYHVGLCYEKGCKIIKQDYVEALHGYTKSHNQGNEEASYRISCMYRDGLGVPKDKKKAEEYFQSAAFKSNTYDQLGEMYKAFQTKDRDQADRQAVKGRTKRGMK